MATYFFIASLAGLVVMGVSKWTGMNSGNPGFLSFLSRFDRPIGDVLIQISIFLRWALLTLRNTLFQSVRLVGHLSALYLHRVLQYSERRVRAWREFARERKIERRSASGFIKDVFEYKNQVKKKGSDNNPPV